MNMDYSAWEGYEIDGHVDTVLSRGKVIVDGDEYLGAKGDGRFLKRGLSAVPGLIPRTTTTKGSADGLRSRSSRPTPRPRGPCSSRSSPRQYGFSTSWTFDSHLLWQEPYVIYSQILAETQRIKVGPFVTNPATRDWTVTASVFATLNEMYGNRTVCGIGRGDSAVRVTNGKPTTLAELRESIHVIRELGNSRPVEYNGSTTAVPVGARLASSRCGSPPTGRWR